jgi:predicted alpha/beta hydrolase family esterase
MAYDFLIIHGSYGSPHKNWIPWLFGELTAKGKTVLTPHFPTPEGQDYKVWAELLEYYRKNGFVDEDTTVITHSISCIFIVKFCVEHNFKIKKFVSVAGFNDIKLEGNELSAICQSFYTTPDELSVFGSLCSDSIAYYSNDDPYVPLAKGKEFADRIGAKHMYREGYMHFNHRNKNVDFSKFAELLDVL